MRVLLVEDESSIRKGIETYLVKNNFEVIAVDNGIDASKVLKENEIDFLLTDINMPKKNGLQLLKETRELNKNLPVIVITAYGSIENAVEAMKLGADDYLTKPLNLFELRIRIDKALKKSELTKENLLLKKMLNNKKQCEMIGNSTAMQSLKALIDKVKDETEVSVLITGASGTGKELIARNLHLTSKLKDNPFITVNCAAISKELFESELFGHKVGAFTNAVKDRDGLFLSANNGTIFLDEVAELPLELQAKLLRVLQEKMIRSVGSDKEIEVNVRVICATNKKLKKLVDQNLFREDLYYRLNVVEIYAPALSERINDIPILVKSFFKQNNASEKYLSEEALEILQNYKWPGNIRELENTIKKLVVICSEDKITKYDLPRHILESASINNIKQNSLFNKSDFQSAVKTALENFEKDYLEYHLHKNQSNISKTTESIGLSRVSLHKKIKEYNIDLDKLR